MGCSFRSSHATVRPDEELAVDIRRHPFDADQLTTQFLESVVIETEVEPDTAIGDAALGDQAPEDLFQDLIKVHVSAPFAATFVLAPGWSLPRTSSSVARRQSTSRASGHIEMD